MSTVEQSRPITEDVDPAVRPQDDLFGHVNSRWISTAQIPEDRSTYGSFDILREQAELDVRDIIERAAQERGEQGSGAQKIGDLYASFMDTDAVEAAGVQPLEPLLERIQSVTDATSLMRLQGELAREGMGGVLGAGVWIDKSDPNRYLIHIAQAGLGLPDESYYRDEEHAKIRQAYVPHVARMLKLAQAVPTDSHAMAAAEQIMAFETRLAEAHWDRTETRDAVKTYNLMTAEELRAALPVAEEWMSGMGVDEPQWSQVVVAQPDVVQAVTALLEQEPVGVWKQWLTWKVIRSMSGYLSDDLVEESFDFYGRTLTGAPKLRPRWKRGVGLVQALVGELVGQSYVAEHYPPRAQEQMEVLVDNLLEAYRQRITDLEWMQADTRQRALAKLEAFTPKIGKPVRWKDYSALEIAPDDLLGNIRRSNAVESDRELAKLDGPVDRDEWFMTPQTVNAYYNPALNEIVFPAAILQPPFFDPDRDPAYNYGAIGAVIGHEIGHGFDDQGSRYDGDGSLRNWWTDEDRERFDAKVATLVEQYNGYSPRDLPDEHTVNGALTVGENIGDLGGVAVAFHAWRLFVESDLDGAVPESDGMTGDQRFFVGWAAAWRMVTRTEEAVRRLSVDPHSPPEFRANVVRNIGAFHDAFATAEGDGLWLDPGQRVDIW
ncbi:MAG: M13 family metallopeptidase [Euzebya sp.]